MPLPADGVIAKEVDNDRDDLPDIGINISENINKNE